MEHYENPRNVGSLDKNSDDVGTVSFYYYYFYHVRVGAREDLTRYVFENDSV